MKSQLIISLVLLVFTVEFSLALELQLEEASDVDFRKYVPDSMSTTNRDLYFITKPDERGLKLRWAPTNPDIWVMGNIHGYTIEKMIVDDTGTEPFLKVSSPFKPLPLAAREPLVDENTPYTAAAVMCIHGELKNPQSAILMESQDFNNRYGFALLAADLDPVAAQASGLAHLDTVVAKEQLCLDRVFAYDPLTGTSCHTVHSFQPWGTPKREPGPFMLDPVEYENTISLQWRKDQHLDRFSAYWIERAELGRDNFLRLNETPFLYEYRLKTIDDDGNSTFAEKNLALEGLKSFYLADIESLAVQKGKDGLSLSWNYNATQEVDFIIYRAAAAGKIRQYKRISGSTVYLDQDIKKKTTYS